MTVKLSSPAKMKGTAKSWSLQAIDTCPGSIDPTTGDLVPACADCYATEGFYLMPATKAVREHNRQGWQHHDWVSEMASTLAKQKHFRWFDSGDMYHLALAHKIYQVMVMTPDTKHWLPTRMHKFPKFAKLIARMQRLPNVVVRRSSDSVTGQTIRGSTSSTIIQTDRQAPPGAHVCPATVPGNKPNCKANNCTACWDKNTRVIAYHFH